MNEGRSKTGGLGFLHPLAGFLAKRPDLGAFAFLALLTLVFFAKYLDPAGEQVLSRPCDLSTQFAWWREFGFGELRKGHLALWNPHLFGGTPFFGGFQSALLYPPNWAFLFLPLGFALNLSMILHFFLAGWFMYLWVRGKGTHAAAALLAALLFMFSGAFFGRILVGHLSNLCAMVWIPLIFWALDGWRRDGRPRWIAWGAAALAMQFFSGHIQYAYYTALAAAFYSAAVLIRTPRRARFLLGVAGLYLLGGLLSAVQLWAGWDAVSESVRSGGFNLDFLDMLDMTPERACTLVMPYFFGGWRDYWGGGLYSEGDLFVTVTGFVLALCAFKLSRDPDRKAFGWMALLVILLMVGKRTPLFALFCRAVPLFDRFRGVSKLNILLALCLALLAALAFDAILRNEKALKGLWKPVGAGGAALLLVSGVFYLAVATGQTRMFRQFVDHAPSMAANLLGSGAFLLALAALLAAAPKRPSLKWAFPVLILGECLIHGVLNLESFDLSALRQEVSAIQATYEKDPGEYRVWTVGSDYTLAAPSGLDIWGEDPMIPLRYARFALATQGYDFQRDLLDKGFFRRLTPALGLLRLRYIFREEGDHLTVQKTDLPELPRAFLVTRTEILKPGEVVRRAAAMDFDPRRTALVEEGTGPDLSGGKAEGRAMGVRVRDLDSDHLDIEAVTDQPALLVLTDNYSRGWRAVPPQAGNPIPVNGFQIGIPLDNGSHHFQLEYRPTTFVAGAWISAAAWAAFLAWLAFQAWGRIKANRGQIHL